VGGKDKREKKYNNQLIFLYFKKILSKAGDQG
jgi:hypothetical protein